MEAQRDKKKVHFATLMDICPFKNAVLEPKIQKYKGRVVLRGDNVKDDSGACAVFHRTGLAKLVGVIACLPDCDGQAGDAVSAHTHAQLEDAPKQLKSPKSKCPDVWIRLPRHEWP